MAGLLLLAPWLALAMPGSAFANCQSNSGNPGTVIFQFNGPITVPNNVTPGTILATSSPVVPSNPQTITCVGNTNSGIVNNIGASPGSDNTLYPTNIAGLSYRLLYPDSGNALKNYPNQSVGMGSISFNGATALQLVATSTIANGSRLSGTLAQWNVDRCNIISFFGFTFCFGNQPTQPVMTYSVSSVRFVSPACSVTTDPTNVTLPQVLSSQFSGTGSTAATTPFAIQLNCANVTTLSITLQTNNPVNGATGVIASSTGRGYAQGVGVQLLDHNAQPVQFGTAISVDGPQSGDVSIPFFARYYQTSGTIGSGQVKATATYTLNYQ
ncbi:MAG: fimbrial protein [Oleiagrimonas sp.]|nr:fimbrial protein [Oleiagrimonas sp.]